MVHTVRFSLASKSAEIRHALDRWQPWLHKCFRSDVGEIVQLRFDRSLAALSAGRLLGNRCRSAQPSAAMSALEGRLEREEYPPGISPAMSLRHTTGKWSAEWLDCPVALYFTGFRGPVIAMNVPYVDNLSQGSQWREIAMIEKADLPDLLKLLEEAFSSGSLVRVMGGGSVAVQPVQWRSLILDDSIERLVRDDFRLFFRRESWFKEHNLPFRRGYLLYGPRETARAA